MLRLLTSVALLCLTQDISAFNQTAFLERNSKTPVGLNDEYQLMDITSWDGITLQSLFFDPKPVSESGNPLVIFISSWGMNRFEYVVPANEFAEKGYTVISYTARGFWGSGGEINLAGEKDLKDLSAVIDWALANTHADPELVGLSGISYGGGISLLGVAKDSRVKSVAAMSGWVDLAESFLGNGETIRTEAVSLLDLLAQITGSPSDELNELFDDYFSNENLEFLYDTTYDSSPVNFLDEINANGASVFIANALEDSLFTPNQFVDFYNDLTVPKHLEFAPGDHAGPELPGIIGLPDQVWDRAGEWLDYYLLQGQAGTDASMSPVIFNTMNGNEVDEYASWADVSSTTLEFLFSSHERLVATQSAAVVAPLDSEVQVKSEQVLETVTTGAGITVNGGIAFVTETIEAYSDIQKPFEMALIDRYRGAVFESDRLGSAYKFRGVPTLHLHFIPEASNGTVVIYLLAVDNLNFGHLFTFSPWTFKDATVNEVNVLHVDMTMTSYDFDPEHRLAVVVATQDPLYLDQNPDSSAISIMDGTTFSMPFHADQ
jgi:predicted acyl esterase